MHEQEPITFSWQSGGGRMTTETQLLREALQQLYTAANSVTTGEYDEEVLDIALSAANRAISTAAQPASGEAVLSLGSAQKRMVSGISDEQRAMFNASFATPPASPAQASGEAVEFFAFHSDMGVEFFNGPDAEATAQGLCEDNLEMERGEAVANGAWSDDRAESIRWGVVLGRSKYFDSPEHEGEDSGDYKMVSYTTPPASQEQAQPSGEVVEVVDDFRADGLSFAIGQAFPPGTKLYTAPQPAQPAERVAMTDDNHFVGVNKMVPMPPLERSRLATKGGFTSSRAYHAFSSGVSAAEAHYGIGGISGNGEG